MKTGILFDLDGTLLATLEDLHSSTNHVLRSLGRYHARSKKRKGQVSRHDPADVLMGGMG